MKFFLIFLFISASTFALDLDGWNKIYEKDSLAFYSKKLKGSDLLNFRAVGIIKIECQEALAILRNVEAAQKWDQNTKLKQTIEDFSDIEAITYSITGIPWPFQNRDLVLQNKLEYAKDRMALKVNVRSIERKDYPHRKKLVRAYLEAQVFMRPVLNAVDPNTSHIDIQILVDPKGSIPHWVVNMVQENMPYDFLKGLERFAHTVDMKPNPGVGILYQEMMKDLNSKNAIIEF